MRKQASNQRVANKANGWSWAACCLGRIWYLTHGMVTKGLVLFAVDLLTMGFAIPIVAIYSGINGRSDMYERQLDGRSKFSPDEL